MKLYGLVFGCTEQLEIESITMTLEDVTIIGVNLVERKPTVSVGTQRHLEHSYY